MLLLAQATLCRARHSWRRVLDTCSRTQTTFRRLFTILIPTPNNFSWRPRQTPVGLAISQLDRTRVQLGVALPDTSNHVVMARPGPFTARSRSGCGYNMSECLTLRESPTPAPLAARCGSVRRIRLSCGSTPCQSHAMPDNESANSHLTLAVCIPIFNDWQSAALLLEQLDRIAAGDSMQWSVTFIDDGSTEPIPQSTEHTVGGVANVRVLRLRRNLGHQRAIAVGLTYLYENEAPDLVVVMDGDGEDDPQYIPKLAQRCLELNSARVVFAQRTKRTEGAMFRVGYWFYRTLHRILVGRKIEVGNFSIIPRSVLARLVGVSEMWNHYAASVVHARLPTAMIPVPRAHRLAGESRMNILSLVTHGLSAISVYSELVGVRGLVLFCAAMTVLSLAIVAVVAVRFLTSLAVPGWATSAIGLLVVSLLNLTSLSMFTVLFALRSRTESSFLPLRDYRYLVLDVVQWRGESSVR